MAIRKRADKNGSKKGGAGKLTLLDEIEKSVESSVRALIEGGKLSVGDLLKVREIVREILAERPHEVVVRWVESCETTEVVESGETRNEPSDESEIVH